MSLEALITALGRFTSATKEGITQIDEGNADDLNEMIDGLTKTYEDQVVELGAPHGGDFNFATSELVLDLDTGTAIDCSLANHFKKTLNTNVTLSVSNPAPAGQVTVFTLSLQNTAGIAVTWWPGIRWNGGAAPTLTSVGLDEFSFTTHDGGATWDGYVLGKNMKAAA